MIAYLIGYKLTKVVKLLAPLINLVINNEKMDKNGKTTNEIKAIYSFGTPFLINFKL